MDWNRSDATIVLASFAAVVLAQTSIPVLTPQELFKRALQSAVVIQTQTGSGSGFLVDRDLVATNYHVIQGAQAINVRLIGQSNWAAADAIAAVDEAQDLALLHVTIPGGVPPQLGSGFLEVGDTVYVVGNPLSLEGTFSQGLVSAFRASTCLAAAVGGPRSFGAQAAPYRCFQITAPVSHGSSGGPVFDARGSVIGVVDATNTEGQNLNFAIPASELVPLVLRGREAMAARSAPKLSPPSRLEDTAFQEGSRLITSGRYEDAILYFNDAIQKYPTDLDLFVWRGNAFFNLEKYPEAIKDYEAAMVLNPQLSGPYVNRSRAREKLGDKKGAAADLKRAEELRRSRR